MKIGLCGNIELEYLAESLDKVFPGNEIVVGCTGAFSEELTRPAGEFTELDVCIVAVDWMKIVPELYECGAGDDLNNVYSRFVEKTDEMGEILKRYRSASRASILVFSPITETHCITGFIDRLMPFPRSDLFAACQKAFNLMCRSIHGLFPVDLEMLSSRVGKSLSFDRWTDCMHNQPFSAEFIQTVSSHVADVCRQLRVSPLKCLVLDLDNTLWGGIVGEAGLKGIILGVSGLGKAFRDFQIQIRKLYSQGIILAVCSKNNTCDALEVIELHEHMVIRPSMISSFRINWNDKPGNILEISRELNIGPDSILFVDDSPTEREQVRHTLPMVEVLELPADPTLYADCLAEYSRFWPTAITEDDLQKGRFFQQENDRRRLKGGAASVEDFLSRSQISVRIKKVDSKAFPRVVQLINKTNQFNLTTRRYSRAELEHFIELKDNELYYMEMVDRYGDYGIVAAALQLGERIDSFLLSCRVFGKQAEKAFLSWILERMKEKGCSRAEGVYVPSSKNRMTKDFYKSMGFRCKEVNDDCTVWELDLLSMDLKVPGWVRISE